MVLIVPKSPIGGFILFFLWYPIIRFMDKIPSLESLLKAIPGFFGFFFLIYPCSSCGHTPFPWLFSLGLFTSVGSVMERGNKLNL